MELVEKTMQNHELAAKIAKDYNLEPALVQAICQVESEWNAYAMRYEDMFEARYLAGEDFDVFLPCSRKTEHKARATSWGLMQIMGQTARELGFSRPFLSELCEPAKGIEYGCMYLSRLVKKHGSDDIEAIVSAYNAGRPVKRQDGKWVNEAYVRKVMSHYARLKEFAHYE